MNEAEQEGPFSPARTEGDDQDPGQSPDIGVPNSDDTQEPDDPLDESSPTEPEDGGEDDELVAEEEPKADDGTVVIRVTKHSENAVNLHINGRGFQLPINKSVTVPAYILPTLDAVSGLEYEQE